MNISTREMLRLLAFVLVGISVVLTVAVSTSIRKYRIDIPADADLWTVNGMTWKSLRRSNYSPDGRNMLKWLYCGQLLFIVGIIILVYLDIL